MTTQIQEQPQELAPIAILFCLYCAKVVGGSHACAGPVEMIECDGHCLAFNESAEPCPLHGDELSEPFKFAERLLHRRDAGDIRLMALVESDRERHREESDGARYKRIGLGRACELATQILDYGTATDEERGDAVIELVAGLIAEHDMDQFSVCVAVIDLAFSYRNRRAVESHIDNLQNRAVEVA